MNKIAILNAVKHYFFVYLLILATVVIWLGNYNYSLFIFINSHHTILPDKWWKGLENIADVRYYIYPVILILITALLKRNKLLNIILLIIASYGLFILLQNLLNVPRPFMTFPRGTFFWLGSYGDSDDLGYPGFPSIHMGGFAIFSFALNSLFFKNKFWVEFLVLLRIILISIARVFAGWHWPLDVLGTLLISYFLVEFCMSINFSKLFTKNKTFLSS